VPQKPSSKGITKGHFPKKKPFKKGGKGGNAQQAGGTGGAGGAGGARSRNSNWKPQGRDQSSPSTPPPLDSDNPFAEFDIVHSNAPSSPPRKSKRPPAGRPRPVRLSRDQQARLAHKATVGSSPLINVPLKKMLEARKVNSCRVVWAGGEGGKNESKVCTLREAWELSRSMELDFTLITPVDSVRGGKEVIVKCVNMEEVERERRRKERENKEEKSKQKSLKEFKFGGGIGFNDRDRLITRAVQSLSKGHQVKVTLMAKRRELNLNPTCLFDLDVTIGKRLEVYGNLNEGRRAVKEGMGRHNCIWTPRQNAKKIMEDMMEETGGLWKEDEEE
ncbi:hypothetical protein TrRE_jg13468, partial [Triparma retinervis]